ncbi:MAG: 50S ribosomal protein L11 methyltransferase [Eggerthellaceae bacterium]|nr:50S ribosomal protein L11 methyltransferase [Eggerthellaceae bacterium]
MMIAHLAGVSEGSRVMDVCCGSGIMVSTYLMFGASHVTAIDL